MSSPEDVDRDLIFDPEYIRGVAMHGLDYRPPGWTGKTARPEVPQPLAVREPSLPERRGRVSGTRRHR